MKNLCILALALAGICLVNGEGIGWRFNVGSSHDKLHRLAGGIKLHLPHDVYENCELEKLCSHKVPPCDCLRALTLNIHIGKQNTDDGSEEGTGEVIDIGKIIAEPNVNCVESGCSAK